MKYVLNCEDLNNKLNTIIKESNSEEDWDELYQKAKEEPIKSKIITLLVEIFKDENILIRVGDNYEWSDGSNGIINFSNFNHYITDIGYKSYADEPELLNDIEAFKKHILYAYASSEQGNFRKGLKYKDFKYNPKEEFSW